MATDEQAAERGISPRAEVRQGLIDLRDAMLTIPRFDEAVLLSHAVWWLAPEESS